MPRTSVIDTQRWVCELKKRGIIQFEYKDLPKDLKSMKFLLKAKEEEFIVRVKRDGDKRSTWKIAEDIKCREEEQE